jgi:UDP-N-acetylglucosamine 2-epimerase (non-hydrolysing)
MMSADRSFRLLTVLGTRPEIIRLSRIIPKLDRIADHVLVHTGQNFTANLSQVFFEELEVRAPDVWLGVDTSSFGRQLGTLFEGFERLLDEQRPDRVLVLGDTNSALVAFSCKRRGIPVYHMEAGNRWVIDHCSAVLLPYTYRSAANLEREGIERHRIFVTGNPIFEVLTHYGAQIDGSPALSQHALEPQRYLLATCHRAENIDRREVLDGLRDALQRVAELYELPLLLSVHPRLEKVLGETAFKGSRVVPLPAMPFFEFVKLEKHAALVVTDSGTVQEECCIFGVPVITIRDATERPETVEAGSNIVASTDPGRILAAARYLRAQPDGRWNSPAEYVDPHVSEKIVRILLSNPEWAAARM